MGLRIQPTACVLHGHLTWISLAPRMSGMTQSFAHTPSQLSSRLPGREAHLVRPACGKALLITNGCCFLQQVFETHCPDNPFEKISWEVNLTILQMNFTSLDPFLKLKYFSGVPVVAQRVTSRINIHEDVGLIPGLTQWVKDQAAV